jgi:hypothetical protein
MQGQAQPSRLRVSDVWRQRQGGGGMAALMGKAKGLMGKAKGLADKGAALTGQGGPGGAAAAAKPAAGGDDQPSSVNDLLGSIADGALTAVKTFPPLFATFIPTLATFLGSMLFVLIVVALMFLAIYILMRISFRMPLPTHSAPVEGFMKRYASDLQEALEHFNARLTADGAALERMGLGGQTSRLRDLSKELLSRGDLEADLVSHFKYHEELASMGFLSRHDLRNNATEFSEGGDFDQDMGEAFTEAVSDKLRDIRDVAGELSDALSSRPDIAAEPGWNAGAFGLASDVHTIRMLLNYEAEITMLYKTRRAKMTMAIWHVYYNPLVIDIYTKRIPDYWLKSPKAFVNAIKNGLNWWGSVGTAIALMPCNMAFSDPAERAKNCSTEDFSQQTSQQQTGDTSGGGGGNDKQASFDIDYAGDGTAGGALGAILAFVKRNGMAPATRGLKSAPIDSGDTGGDVVEGAGLATALNSIVKFIKSMSMLGKAISHIGNKFATDAFGALISIFSLIFGAVFGLIFILVYMLITFSAGFYLLLIAWSVIISFVMALLGTVYQILLMIVLCIPYFILWLIDLVTSGFVSRTLRCENLPDDWINRGGFAEGNKWDRIGFGCFAPCRARYSVFGCLCNKRAHYLPDYCPQQQIMRMFRRKGLTEPYVFHTYKAQPGFGSKSLMAKQKLIVSAFRDKLEFYQKCYVEHSDFDYVNRHVCGNFELMKKTHSLSDDAVKRIVRLCKECYCDYAPKNYKTEVSASLTHEGDRGSPLCMRLLAGEKAALNAAGGSGPATALMKRVMLMGILVIGVLVTVYSMLQASKKMMQDATRGL